MNSNSLRRAIATGALLVLIGTLPAFSYRMIQNTSVGTVSAGNLVTCNDPGGFIHWTSSSISWYLNPAGQGSGKATAIQNALTSWTNVANADHILTYAGTTSAGWATDGQNTVVWSSGNGCTFSCLALTALTLRTGQVIVESDITFNSAYSWQTSGTDYDTGAVATHEFGHSLGIHHTDMIIAPDPTMSAFYFGNAGRTLESDDISALQCAQARYPFSGTPPPTWTAWLDRDDPPGAGDWENISEFRADGNNICNGATPIGIECQTLSGVNWTNTGQTYICTPTTGGICQNSQQQNCQDYRVRFQCP